MICPKCKSENVSVSNQMNDLKTKEKKKGLLHGILRLTLIMFTCGLWLLVPSQRGSSRSNISYTKVAVCQNCAHSWKV